MHTVYPGGTQILHHTTATTIPQLSFLNALSSSIHAAASNTQDTRSDTGNMPPLSIKAFIQRRLVPQVFRAVRAPRLFLEPTQAQLECCGPPFRSPHTLPTEIILRITESLDEISSMALRHTNRDLFYIISLNPDQLSRVRKALYLTAVVEHTTNTRNKGRLGFCMSCQELRPLRSFSLSEVRALESLQQASCLRHSQLWICPHVSCDYKRIVELPRPSTGFCGIIDERAGFPSCGGEQCQLDFKHEICGPSAGSHQCHLDSKLFISLVDCVGGPGTLRDTIQRSLTKAQIQKAMDNIRVPICDHHLLNDEEVRSKYDPADIDLDVSYWHGVPFPEEHMRTIRRSDGSCSYCQAVGVQTKFRFVAWAYRTGCVPETARIILEVVLIRSLAAHPKRQGKPDKHWRCHGMTERRIADFRDSWIPSGLYDLRESSDGGHGASQPLFSRQVVP